MNNWAGRTTRWNCEVSTRLLCIAFQMAFRFFGHISWVWSVFSSVRSDEHFLVSSAQCIKLIRAHYIERTKAQAAFCASSSIAFQVFPSIHFRSDGIETSVCIVMGCWLGIAAHPYSLYLPKLHLGCFTHRHERQCSSVLCSFPIPAADRKHRKTICRGKSDQN